MKSGKNLRNGKIRLGAIALGAVVAFVVFVFVVWMFGRVSGEEFSPQKFSMRRFIYWRVPLLRVQVWPVSLSKVNGADDKLAKHIRMNRLHGPVSGAPVHWDIAHMTVIGQNPYYGDATILTNYLKQPGAVGLESLYDWTTAHPKQAKHMWTLVSMLASEGLYSVIPDVLESARSVEPNKAVTEMARVVGKKCRTLANAEKAAGDTKKAAATMLLAQQIEAESFRVRDDKSGSDDAEANVQEANAAEANAAEVNPEESTAETNAESTIDEASDPYAEE